MYHAHRAVTRLFVIVRGNLRGHSGRHGKEYELPAGADCGWRRVFWIVSLEARVT